MSADVNTFWHHFKNKDFRQAQQSLASLSEVEAENILSELYKKSECQQKPVMVSVLRRELQDDKNFSDFYNSWYPSAEMCKPIEQHGLSYAQHFPTPVRVLNAINIHKPNEIISVGITWVANEEAEKELWAYIDKASQGEDKNNETRHQRISKTADGELLGLFKVETDDNLGTPF